MFCPASTFPFQQACEDMAVGSNLGRNNDNEPNVELDPRRVERPHDIVGGGLPAPSQVSTEHMYWSPFRLDLQSAVWYTQIHGPLHLAMPAGL